MGLLSLVYLAGYALSQIVIFFFRGTEPITPFLGITIFKQAQWTGIILLLALIPYGVVLLRTSRPWSGWIRARGRHISACFANTERFDSG